MIERVTFFNEESGFAVLKVKVKGQREPVTVIGSLASVSAGEWLTAEGRWNRNREFGMEFKADLLTSTAPTTREGIEKYLGSGMVKGIGPVYAKKLVEKFGEKIFDIIETESGRLQEIEGIGPERRKRSRSNVGKWEITAPLCLRRVCRSAPKVLRSHLMFAALMVVHLLDLSLVAFTASYSREAEQNADNFSIEVMHRLGRPTKPMGDLIFRVTGNQGDNTLSILANHPLTEDRLKHLSDENRPSSGPPLLSEPEWAALKAICKPGS